MGATLLTPLDVRRQIDLVGQFRDVDLEPVLNVIQGLGVGLVGHEGDGQPLGSKTSSSGHAMKIGICVLGHVVIEHDVDPFDVHASTKQVGGNQNTLKRK